MEVLGTALGVVGTIGVLGQIYTGCMRSYAVFTTATNMGKDSERLICKVRIEEMRFIVWGREWGVAEGKLDAHLSAAKGDSDGLKKLAEVILKQLLDTIGNSKKLRDRYGVKETASHVDEKGGSKATESSTSHWGGLKMRTKWVINDKEKFEVLLRDLKDFNDGLERLFPPARIATFQRTWTYELLQTAERDVSQLNLLEDASSGVYPQLNTTANLKQLRINLDAKDSTKFKPTTELKVARDKLTFTDDDRKRITGQYQKTKDGPQEPIIIEWITYEADADLDTRLIYYQRVDNLARMEHSASNRHPDLHTLDCMGYFDDSAHARYGLTYRIPPYAPSPIPRTLISLIDDNQLRTPDLEDRFKLAQTLSIALWSVHSLDWLHKTFCSNNILFFNDIPSAASSTPTLSSPYVTGFDSARPEHLDEMTVASKNDSGTDLYRHPDSLGVWRQSYRKAFDIYSLGLVLLEIGLWKNLKDFHKPKHTPAAFRDKVVLSALVPRLGSKTGRTYQHVVERDGPRVRTGTDNDNHVYYPDGGTRVSRR
ncbi:MAG: hypothetical protein M1838_002903 [Thelocarpon superellum]|nr:MAG: hypothetical protein M1838_002903 [Thelocarpon superellum]